jgi:hypothetical protein
MTDRPEPGWCDKCQAHVIPMGVAELALAWVCWQLVMHWPDRFFMSRPHAAVLPWAGCWAFRCTCWANNRKPAP